jgi:hypothetical protein
MPAELGPGLGRVGALIEQQDLGEIVAQARPSLIIGTGDRSWSAACAAGSRRSTTISACLLPMTASQLRSWRARRSLPDQAAVSLGTGAPASRGGPAGRAWITTRLMTRASSANSTANSNAVEMP